MSSSNISGTIGVRCLTILGDLKVEGAAKGLEGHIAGNWGRGDASECLLERIRGCWFERVSLKESL